tara:strand:+ start:203 stop:430 length:228 start_codon:yes stop_codon:yes gene_type:complete
MQEYTPEEIEGTRNYFQGQSFEEVEVVLGERTFSYFVMPQSLNPDLKDFVFRCTGKPEDGAVFGISDSVREDFRQ